LVTIALQLALITMDHSVMLRVIVVFNTLRDLERIIRLIKWIIHSLIPNIAYAFNLFLYVNFESINDVGFRILTFILGLIMLHHFLREMLARIII